MALATTYAKGSKTTGNAAKAYDDYVQEQAKTVSGRPVTEAAQQSLGQAAKGQTYSSNYYDGNVTTKKYNADGTIAGTDVRPYERTTSYQPDGTIVTQQSPLSVTYKKPTTRVTTATTKDGQSYTFDGDNWVTYAQDNGLDPNSLATAITYPNYVNAKEANRYINEMGSIYGVTPGAPVGNGDVYSKSQGINKIPDYNTPYASAAAGQTPTSQAYFEGLGINFNTPTGNIGTMGTTGTGYGNGGFNINASYGSGNANAMQPAAYQPFNWANYITDAMNSYNNSINAQKQASDAKFEATMDNINRQYDQNAQDAYIVNYIANRALEDSLKESGIKGGAAESSLLKGQTNFENAYNENERARAMALADVELQKALTDAGYTSQQAEIMAEMILQGAQFEQAENAAMNNYNWNLYESMQNQANADREFDLDMQQYEDSRQMEMAKLAYELGDLKQLQEMGYDTTLAQAEIEAQMRKLAGTGTGGGSEDESKKGGKGDDGYITNPTAVLRNGDGDEISVIYVDGRPYNINAVRDMINNGTAYITDGGTVKMLSKYK
jgi:hypothetical protein